MIFKVDYTKLALMKDGSTGNIPQGTGIAYMNCELHEIEKILSVKLGNPVNKHRFAPIIEHISLIKGDIVIS